MPYRKKLNFTFDGLKAAATSIDRLRNYKLRLETDKFPGGTNAALAERTRAASTAFDAALDDDLNTAEALGTVFEYIRDTNTAMDAGEFLAGNVDGRARIPGSVRLGLRCAETHRARRRPFGCRSGRAHRRTHRRQEIEEFRPFR